MGLAPASGSGLQQAGSPGTEQSPGTGTGVTPLCNPPDYPTGDVTISIWTGTDTTSQALGREIVQEYQKLHPNVHIDNTPTSAVDAYTKMTVALPAGLGQPTTALSYEPLMATFIDAGYMEPLNPAAMCASSQQELIDLYIPGSIDPLIRDGNLYGMPAQRNAYSLLLNNDKFTAAGLKIPDDVPTTWDELAALQPKLKVVDASGKTTQKGFEFRYTAGDQWFGSQFIGMVNQAGGEVIDDQGKAHLNSPEALVALQNWLKNVVDPSVTNNQGPSPYQDFADELDVMAFGGPNALRFAYILNPSLEGRVSVWPLPRASEDSDISGMAYGFHQLINKNASPDEKFVASNFIGYMFSDPNRWWQATGQLQPRVGWYQTPEAQAFEGLNVFIDDLAHAKGLPRTPNYGVLQTAIKNAIQRSVFEGVDPQQSLDQAQQEYESNAQS
jgi:ABC-type glycerol-3-phosphate transport system substrate-binding protein